jgi:hypothetical protein
VPIIMPKHVSVIVGGHLDKSEKTR